MQQYDMSMRAAHTNKKTQTRTELDVCDIKNSYIVFQNVFKIFIWAPCVNIYFTIFSHFHVQIKFEVIFLQMLKYFSDTIFDHCIFQVTAG